jgi:glycosyltransferase involved in cell wall biosynthesis
VPKVVHVITGLGLGGAETMLVQLTTRLRQRGHSQYVVSLNGRGVLADALEAGGVEVIDLAIRTALGGASGLIRLRSVISRVAPDVVQGWMYHGNLAATLSHFASSGRVARQLFWNLRASNMDSGRYGGVIAWNARLSRFADTIVVNSHAGAQFHIDRGFDPRRLAVVANGIDTERFRPDVNVRAALRSAYDIAPDAVLVIHPARVDPMKDHETFLAVMCAMPNLKAVLVGAGTESLPLPPNVRAIGLQGNLEHFYPAADIVVSSSAFGEGFSNTIAEGMSSGLIPVATDVGDAGLIIGSAGRIVPPKDAGALGAALAEIASMSAERRRDLGLAARTRMVENFTIEQAVSNYERLYFNKR